LNTDSRRMLSFSAGVSTYSRPDWNQVSNNLALSPKIRVNDKLSFNYNIDYGKTENSIGYVTKLFTENDHLENIIFGLRDIQTVTNTFGGRFIFSNKMGLNLRMRHYWSKVNYNDYYDLTDKGRLAGIDYKGINNEGTMIHNTNFNAFNIDLVYSWQIGPGSFMNIVWKDAIFTDSNDVSPGFVENFGQTITAPQMNSVSIKLLYYLDYLNIKKIFKSKSPIKSNDKHIIAFDNHNSNPNSF
jgi:hypothetical protein